MNELLILLLCIIATVVVAMIAYRPFVAALRVVEYGLVGISILVILGLMFFVSAEVVMRYGFNSPIPGHLELSELLILAVIFLAVSYTQRTHGHVGMDLVLDSLGPNARRRAVSLNLVVSIFVCAVVSWFSAKQAHQYWLYDDVTMTDPYFKTWPWAATISLGYWLLAMRMVVQLLSNVAPDRFPDDTPEDHSAMHQASD